MGEMKLGKLPVPLLLFILLFSSSFFFFVIFVFEILIIYSVTAVMVCLFNLSRLGFLNIELTLFSA